MVQANLYYPGRNNIIISLKAFNDYTNTISHCPLSEAYVIHETFRESLYSVLK
jgi:hypothetical protein